MKVGNKGETMKIYHVKTQQDYDALMIELEEKGCKWRNGEKLTHSDNFKRYDKDTYIYNRYGAISFSDGEYFKAHHSDEPLIEYKAKGENMTQKEMKHKLHEVEPALQHEKSSAKNLIEKIDDLIENIDEYLESLKPKFKVGDYVTVYVNSKRKIAKIAKIDELTENNSKVHGLWYDRTLVNVKQDYWFSSGLNEFRHATPSEIEEYESALTFHKHGRKPFEIKQGDILSYSETNKLFVDDPSVFKKEHFTIGRYTFLKTVEEVSEWLGADDE